MSEPTREDSILDLVITNMEIGGKLGSSGHQEISFKIKWDIKIPPNQVQVPDFMSAGSVGFLTL